jgi:peptide/nickel transport system substrate-binding protein
MKTAKPTTVLVLATVLALGAAACGGHGGSNNGSGGGGSGGSAAKDAALTSVVNPSTKKGGTVKLDASDAFDLDPGDTYYGWVENFSRLYARTLLTFQPAPGKAGLKLVPDLATSLGTPSDGARTWTYHLRTGLTFQDGTPITSQDVKYAIERSNFAPEVLSDGPTYFRAYLKGGASYKGPYKDKSKAGLKSIATPDAHTIVFHLNRPFADFDYLASFSQTAPVPAAKDTGATYKQHIVSSGPYEFKSYQEGIGATLVRNPKWDPKTDPVRKALPDKYVIRFKVNPQTIDNDLLAGNITVDGVGLGVQSETQSKVLSRPALLRNTDDSISGALSYIALSTKVKPFDNVNCRQAVEWAVDKTSVQDAEGGAVKGDIATTVLPPSVNGYRKFDLYPSTGGHGNVAKAKAALVKCGHPNGFSTTLTARTDRQAETDAATAIQAALKKVGIKVSIQTYPSGKYFSNYAGVPSWVHAHGAGMMMMAWGADWPTGYGFLDQIADGSAIKPSGGDNLSELNDPTINKALSSAIANTNTAARTKAWGDIDELIMKQAAIVPLLYSKNLLYRPPSATNVTVTQTYLGMYDYLALGSSQ